MRIEWLVLVASVIIGFLQIFAAVAAATRQRGTQWNMGARDEILPPLSGLAGRLDRALQNFKETFPLFLAALFFVNVMVAYGPYSEWGSLLYLISRLLYLPAYCLNIRVVRTLIWCAGVLGIGLMLGQGFFSL